MSARTLMVLGCASNVGKSLLVTALCRLYARRGLRVAPFKAQNLALNSAVTADGLEMGRAQFVQAQAARVAPRVEMNPLLLKPESTRGAQLVLLGRSQGSLSVADYEREKPALREVVRQSLRTLRAAHDLVILEGAGSPVEMNLKEGDLANLWAAEQADAPVLLVADIERGGAMAALLGTLMLLEPAERARVRGLVINKFHGELALFADGVRFLEERCGVPVLGVLPHLGDPGIAGEDMLDQPVGQAPPGAAGVALVRLPHLSNFDEFDPLARGGVPVRWCERPEELAGAQLVILPGTKSTVADLRWLRERGVAAALVQRAQRGEPVLGICGGYQMLGEQILDPQGVESPEPEVPGLGLLPVVTRFEAGKRVARVELRLGEGVPFLETAGGQRLQGYQIHCGRVTAAPGARTLGTLRDDAGDQGPEGAVGPRGVFGTTVHGLFENPAAVEALRCGLGGPVAGGPAAPAIDPYDRLADRFGAALDLAALDRIIGL